MENKVVIVDMINVYYSASFLRPLKPVLADKIQISSVLARNDTHTLTLAPQAFSLESWVSGDSSRSDTPIQLSSSCLRMELRSVTHALMRQ